MNPIEHLSLRWVRDVGIYDNSTTPNPVLLRDLIRQGEFLLKRGVGENKDRMEARLVDLRHEISFNGITQP